MNKIYRHGDICLTPIKTDKKLELVKRTDRFVLAEGETTGHKHLLTAESQTEFEVLKDEEGRLYLCLEGKADLTHEEHNKIEVMPDLYVIGNEQEWNYFENAAQKVID
ncbi:MAG: hypothetical protein PHT54_03430 [Candidatus Nanoarchaeia archaeon]|nr:hypothetical protein [Candidatus Nanoarchaeia archaeon]